MPRIYPPRRTLVGFRIGEAALQSVDQHAQDEGIDRSEALRRLLDEALAARRRATFVPPRTGGDAPSDTS